MSQSVMDSSVGFNGSFEVVVDEKPVNWMLYTPETVADGKFKVYLDDQNVAEGSHSLVFEVEECSDKGGRFSPGLAKEIMVEPNSIYSFSFWLNNQGSAIHVNAGGVSETEGNVRSLLRINEETSDWRQYNFQVNSDGFEKLRMEFSVVAPGKLWIDNVKCEKIN